MDIAKLEKMKVAELRNELQARGLDIKGVKAVLIERLKAAIDAKTPVVGTTEVGEVSTPSRRSRRTRSMTRSPSPSPVKKPEAALEPLEEEKQELENETSETESNDKKSEEVSPKKAKEDEQSANTENEDEDRVEVKEAEAPAVEEEQKEESEPSAENGATAEEQEEENEQQEQQQDEKPEKMDVDDKETESKEERGSPKQGNQSPDKKDKRLSRKRSHSKSKSRSRSRSRSRTRDRSRSRSRSKTSRSSKGKRASSPTKNIDDSTNEEDEPAIEDKQFGLSWLDSDLHLLIDPVTFTSAKQMSQEIFTLVWSGARTNYGVREGKVCYEVRLAEESNVNQFKDEPYIRGLRCGFSTCKTSLLLGEDDNSFAYCESGKKALKGEFEEYGKSFKLDDVIGCYLDLDSTPCTIKFTLNGEDLGTAFEFDKSILGEENALFPHVVTKGYEFVVNFADSENLLGNVERPKRMRKKEKPRKGSLKSEEKRNRANSASEDTWEVVDEAKMDDNENEENKEGQEEKKDAPAEKTEAEDESKPEEAETKQPEAETEEEVKKMETDEAEKTEVDEGTKEAEKDNEDVEMPEEKKENGEKATEEEKKESSPTKRNRESRDSNQEDVMEEIEPEAREPVVLIPGFELIALISEEKYISGPQRPESRKECEVYLLVGLPGSGKTHWTLNFIKENPDKCYHVIGADELIARMTIDGKPRKPLHKGNWDRVYELCTHSLPSLEEIATKRRRNYILDQTNAFASAQRRKMKGFGDFKRNAVVCIPSEDELKRRNQLKTEAGNEYTIRESTLNNLKANFTLPSLEFDWFDKIIFTDLKDDEAKEEVKRYNEKGNKEVEASRDKRQRRDYRHRDDHRRYDDRRRDDFRGSRWKGNHNDRRGGSGNRWGPPSRGSSGPWREDRGYGGGRNYDNRNNRYSSGGGGGSQNWANNNRNRYDDRFGRSGGGGGGGGGGRYDSYSSGSRDYRDRGRDRNGDDGGNRRDSSYRSGNQRDFRSGHRDLRTEDSRGGFERSKYSSSNDGYEYSKAGGNVHNNSSSQGKWVQMQGGQWGGGQHQMQQQQQTPQQQQQDYWGYDQSQAGYGNQQQWPVNSADPRQQQWMNWYQNNPQSQQQGMMPSNNSQQQYWSQYSYPNQGGTTGMGTHSTSDGSSKK